MSNENALDAHIAGNNLADPSKAKEVANAFQASADEASTGGQFTYLKMDGRSGAYSIDGYGHEFTDEHFCMLPEMLTEGFILWQGSNVKDRRVWSIADRGVRQVTEEELPPHNFTGENDGWKPMRGMSMFLADREIIFEGDERKFFVYQVMSSSAINALMALVKEVGNRIAAGDPCYPVFTLSSELFTAQGNTNSKPVFDVAAWLTQAEAAEIFDSFNLQEVIEREVSEPVETEVLEAEVAETEPATIDSETGEVLTEETEEEAPPPKTVAKKAAPKTAPKKAPAKKAEAKQPAKKAAAKPAQTRSPATEDGGAGNSELGGVPDFLKR